MHLEVASLLSCPLAGWVRGARRYPDASRLDVDEDEKVEIDHAFDRPLPFRREVALPHRGGMAFQEVGPRVGMIARIGTEPRFDQDVLHRLPRDPMAKPAHGLNDLGIAPAGLFTDSDDRIGDALVGPGPARFAFRSRFRPFRWPVFRVPDPAAERRVAHDRNQVFNP